MRLVALAALAAIAAIAAPASAAVNIWSTSFDSGYFETTGPFPWSSLGVTFGGGTIESSGSVPGSGTSLFRNTTPGTTIFDATGLGAHTSLELGFDITFVDSWDSDNGVPGVTPDWLFVNIDGMAPMQWTVPNQSGSNTVIAPTCSLLSSGSNTVGNGFVDATYRCAFSFAHSTNTWGMTIAAGGAGFQYGNDESWAIDNFSLAANAVPEPATWAMLIAGFGLVGVAMRRRKTLAA
ncbi:PEPxxWA-CTERM sorting domain-containing protein [Sandaracinobacteroides saxicola]|uniref:PEP-CTERM sorting domain-containing protein n=1 Tax=Sandaracinobacteroides saxicola TaxID=2759707 RepID=A0A7G5IE72_9SPHN|nr:PEPxxWA-CTERM sorting domain-containing protein [Sandaracinobacteroides saxicola]QMW21664.1 PEP-CTERM sorting domain-containing protein [Sandaracinobacteroides saxicola]